MMKFDIEDILRRLKELHAYQSEIESRLEHEPRPAAYPALFFSEQIKDACEHVENACPAGRPEACAELSECLIRTYRYYESQLILAQSIVFSVSILDPKLKQ